MSSHLVQHHPTPSHPILAFGGGGVGVLLCQVLNTVGSLSFQSKDLVNKGLGILSPLQTDIWRIGDQQFLSPPAPQALKSKCFKVRILCLSQTF